MVTKTSSVVVCSKISFPAVVNSFSEVIFIDCVVTAIISGDVVVVVEEKFVTGMNSVGVVVLLVEKYVDSVLRN